MTFFNPDNHTHSAGHRKIHAYCELAYLRAGEYQDIAKT